MGSSLARSWLAPDDVFEVDSAGELPGLDVAQEPAAVGAFPDQKPGAGRVAAVAADFDVGGDRSWQAP